MTSRRALAESEHKRRQARRHRRRQALIGLAAVGVTILTVMAVAADRLLRPGAFPIKELRLEGEFNHLNPDTVRAAIVRELGDNYFSLDLSRIEQAVEALPWAYQATVQRSWPHGLTVRVEEQHPVARWGEKNWLNDKAEIIELEQMVETDLVSLSGPDGVAAEVWRKYNEWLPLLRSQGMEIGSLDVDERYAWSLQVILDQSKHKFQVFLGVDDHNQRLNRFLSAFATLKPEGDSLLHVDLRYPNGMAVTRRDVQQEHEVVLNEVD